jgi:8-oxo-dGTP diphosphatase
MSQPQLPSMPQAPAAPVTVGVAAAVLRRADGRVLLACRPASKVYAGYWEFPGGKVEPGETEQQALVREIREELAIEVTACRPWVTQIYAYPHATVRLQFFIVTAWEGEPQAVEHSALSWQRPQAIDLAPLLPANGPILRGLLLPEEYAISNAAEVGREAFLQALRRRVAGGLRLLQLREIAYSPEAMTELAEAVMGILHPYGGKLLINNDIALAHRVRADGVHLTARQAASLRERPDLALVGVSCHNRDELEQAQRLAADFAVLGPVQRTATHPEREPMGWQAFAQAISGSSIPVFALGGLQRSDCNLAWQHGAHGLAMIRGSWAEAAR